MINIPFFSKSPGTSLGIDIGTSSIKFVEIAGGSSATLENYGEVFMRDFVGEAPVKDTEGSLLYSNEEISEALKYLLKEAGVKNKKAYFSIPDFVSFFTSFNLPPMKKEEVGSAVQFHSRQYIPLPISEVVLDWFLAEGEEGKEMKINLVAVPKEVVEQYQDIARLCGMEISALEGEMFAVVRAFTRDTEEKTAIVDIGEQSTLLTVSEKGILRTTHSLEIAGNMLVKQLAKAAKIEYNEAKKVMMEYGIEEETVRKITSNLATSLFSEISRAIRTVESKEGKEVKRVIIAGGFSLLPGVVDYAKDALDKEVITKNCFEGIKYPETLEEDLKEISPSHAIALGMALGGIEKGE